MTHVKTYNKSPRRINHKATKSKTNTGTTALERSVEQTTGRFKALGQWTDFNVIAQKCSFYQNRSNDLLGWMKWLPEVKNEKPLNDVCS